MANLKIDITSHELVEIIGDYVKEKYNLKSTQDIVIGFVGESPLGAVCTVTENPKLPPVKPFSEND